MCVSVRNDVVVVMVSPICHMLDQRCGINRSKAVDERCVCLSKPTQDADVANIAILLYSAAHRRPYLNTKITF